MCNLGAINLAEFIRADAVKGVDWFSADEWSSKTPHDLAGFVAQIVDEEDLRSTATIAVRMLDNVIDLTNFPVDLVNRRSRETRRVGMGIMGLADALMKAMVPYDSVAGRLVAGRMMEIIADQAEKTTKLLAGEKGAFPLFSKSSYRDGDPRRNAALLTVAPTGTTSLVFNVCGGVEPYFSLFYNYEKKAVLDGKTEIVTGVNQYLVQELRARYPGFADEVIAEVKKNGGTLLRGKQDVISKLPLHFRKIYATAMDVSPDDHVHMQAALQKYVDNSMSKTINLPNSATVDDVLWTYKKAWMNGCKGCTVYRDGSRVLQVLTTDTADVTDSTLVDAKIRTPPAVGERDDLAESCRLDAAANGGSPCVVCNE